jgi:hypothetical protein
MITELINIIGRYGESKSCNLVLGYDSQCLALENGYVEVKGGNE